MIVVVFGYVREPKVFVRFQDQSQAKFKDNVMFWPWHTWGIQVWDFVPYSTEQNYLQFTLELEVCKISVAPNFGRREEGLRRMTGVALPN